jgi:alpha-tubulin suppressor-like RCC1 family protein
VIRRAERWTPDVVHELQSAVRIEAGGTLVIEAGTRVEGRPGSSIAVARDGRLLAEGTATEPVELTCTSVPRYAGCWGGVRVLGNAGVNHGTPTSPAARGTGAAGCVQAAVSNEMFGGCDDADSSGVLRFTRIEYARDGLQLLGVGSATVIDYVQVNRARNDGLTINGGTVDLRHLFLTANAGFGMSWFGGWSGRGQFISVQQDADINRGGIRGSNGAAEGATGIVGTPRSNPTLYNVTVVSPSLLANPNHAALPAAIVLAEGTSGTLRNVLVYAPFVGLDVRDELTCTPFDGTVPTLRSVLVAGATHAGSPDNDAPCDAYLSPNLEEQWLADPVNTGSVVSDPALVATLRLAVDLLLPDLRPSSISPLLSVAPGAPPSDGFFDLSTPPFLGSIDLTNATRSNIPWYSGWTSPAPVPPLGGVLAGIVGAPPRGPFGGVTVSSASGASTVTSTGGDYTLSVAAGAHLLTVQQLPTECAAAPVSVQVPSGGTVATPIGVSCTALISVAPGPTHVCGAAADGRALCWGANDQGTLGTGSTSPPASTPVTVASPFALTSLTTGYNHSCALGPGGVAFCWGLNAFAALGNGSIGGATAIPTSPASGGISFASIAAGGYHTCALTTAGEAWCWGLNLEGQTGIGVSGSPIILPERVMDGGLRFVQLTAGDSHTCALTAAGAAYCWGGNGRGELGDDPAVIGATRTTPFAVPGGHVFARIDAGRTHTCGVTTTGLGFCWGERDAGQTGDGTIGGMTIGPALVVGAHTFSSISAGSQTTCGIATSGAAYCWGRGDGGLLGDGSLTSAITSPVAVSGGLPFVDVALSLASASGGVACAYDAVGRAWCWGAGELGQRGDGTFTATVSAPVPVRLPAPF